MLRILHRNKLGGTIVAVQEYVLLDRFARARDDEGPHVVSCVGHPIASRCNLLCQRFFKWRIAPGIHPLFL